MKSSSIGNYLNGLFACKKEKAVKFVIFGRGRSGSTLLQKLLDSLPNVQCEQEEIFKKKVLFPTLYIRDKCTNSDLDVYGFKILTYQLRRYSKRIQKIFLNYLIYNNYKIIYLKRQNLLSHAISNIRARELYFHNESDKAESFEKIFIKKDDLIHWLEGSETQEKYERSLLDGIPHLNLIYEEHLESPTNHQKTVNLICNFLRIKEGEAVSRLKKASPKKIEDSILNYDEIKKYLLNTRFRDYL